MPSKTLVRQIDMEIGEARKGIAQLEAEVQRLATAREALVPGEPDGKAPARARRTARRRTPRRTAGRSSGRSQSATPASPVTRMIAENLLRVDGQSFTAPAFYTEYGQGNWNELTTFSVFKRLENKGLLARAGKDGPAQLWEVKDREQLGALVAA